MVLAKVSVHSVRILKIVASSCSDSGPFGGAGSKPAHMSEQFQKHARQVITCLPILAVVQSGKDLGEVGC